MFSSRKNKSSLAGGAKKPASSPSFSPLRHPHGATSSTMTTTTTDATTRRAEAAPLRLDSPSLKRHSSSALFGSPTKMAVLYPNESGKTNATTIHALALFGFDEALGNSLLARFPPREDKKRGLVMSHTDAELAEIMLPDGGHLRQADGVAVIVRRHEEPDVVAYGYGAFRNIPSAKLKRGAIQATVLLIGERPYLSAYDSCLGAALEAIAPLWGDFEACAGVLRELMDRLNTGLTPSTSARASFSSLSFTKLNNSCADDRNHRDNHHDEEDKDERNNNNNNNEEEEDDDGENDDDDDDDAVMGPGLRCTTRSAGSFSTSTKRPGARWRRGLYHRTHAPITTPAIEVFSPLPENHPTPPTETESDGASLRELLSCMREKVMHLWYALASEKRVVLCAGSPSVPARFVSTLVLSLPLLLGELAPLLMPSLEPYLTLAVVDRLTAKKSFVAGCNNRVFTTKPSWWDVCVEITPGSSSATLTHSKSASGGYSNNNNNNSVATHVTGTDFAFVSKVLYGMDRQGKSEAWLRRQFHDYTLSFLNRVARGPGASGGALSLGDLTAALRGLKSSKLLLGKGILASKEKETNTVRPVHNFLEAFKQGGLWKAYTERRDAQWGGRTSSLSHENTASFRHLPATSIASATRRPPPVPRHHSSSVSLDASEILEKSSLPSGENVNAVNASRAAVAPSAVASKPKMMGFTTTGFLAGELEASKLYQRQQRNGERDSGGGGGESNSSGRVRRVPPPPPTSSVATTTTTVSAAASKSRHIRTGSWILVENGGSQAGGSSETEVETDTPDSAGGGGSSYYWNVETDETAWELPSPTVTMT